MGRRPNTWVSGNGRDIYAAVAEGKIVGPAVTPESADGLALEISRWFDDQLREKIPAEAMCEAFMMLPMIRWLSRNGFKTAVPEYWDRSQPYHAFDVRSERMGEEYLFDLKFFRKKKFNGAGIAGDIRHLSNPAYGAHYRYCVVSGAIDRFPQDNDIVEQFKNLVSSNGVGDAVARPLEIKIRRGQEYITTICRVDKVVAIARS